MNTIRRSLLLLGLASTLSLIGYATASAATTFTVDELDPPGMVVAGGGAEDPRVRFTGTIDAQAPGGILLYIDDTLVSCNEYFGNDPNDRNTCYRIAAIDGNTWKFVLPQSEVERLGIQFFGVHLFRFTRVEIVDGRAEFIAEVSVTAEVVAELPVVEPARDLPTLPGVEVDSRQTSAPSASQLSSGSVEAPSVLSALRTAAEATASAPGLLLAAAGAIVLLLLVVLPSELLDQTLGQNYDRIMARPLTALRRGAGKLASRTRSLLTRMLPDTIQRISASTPAPTWIPVAAGIAVASIIGGFVDPGFGWNVGSIRVFVSLVLMFVIESVLGWFVVRALVRRLYPEIDPRPEFKYSSLVILLLAVIISRIVAFEPGMVFGLIEGLAFGIVLAGVREVRVTMIGLGWVLGLGIASWIGYSLLAGGTGFVAVFAAETLSGLTIGCLATLPILLLPLSGFDGSTIYAWKRWVWAVAYGAVLLIFFVVLLPIPESWGEVGVPLLTWIGLFIAYAVFAVAVWAWFRFRRPATPARGPDDAAPVATRAETAI